jgi:hypothetical protein
VRGLEAGLPRYVFGQYTACVAVDRGATAVASFAGKDCDNFGFAAAGPCMSLMLRDGGFEACSRFEIVEIVAVAVAVVGSG